MKLHIEKDSTEVSEILAEWITNLISASIDDHGSFTWSLSGGSSPKMFYELLAKTGYSERISWNNVHLFFGDERYVPFNDIRNNGHMVSEAMIKHVPIPADHVHYINTEMKPEDAASSYEKLLLDFFDKTTTSFDLTLLGLGEEGHTLSLFPDSPVIHEKSALVKALYLNDQEMYRITLTPPLVNRSRQIAFLVTGQNKATAMNNILRGPYNPDKFPAQIIKPSSGELHWFVDEAAVSLL